MMNQGGFVTKQQFQAVYNHFRKVVTKAEADGNMLHVEFNLLLEYFRTVYSDSNRKTNKILLLSTKIAKDGSMLDKLGSDRARENKELSLQVSETKRKIDELVQKEHALLKQMDRMKALIKKLKMSEGDDERNFVDIGIVTDPTDETREWQTCEICSKKSREGLNEILKEMDYQDRQKGMIHEMTTKMNVLKTELAVANRERNDLKSLTSHYSKLLEESRMKLEQGEKNRKAMETHASEKASMKVTIDKLEKDLCSKKSELQVLQEKLRKETSKWSSRALEWRSTDKLLEDARKALQAAQKAEEAALKKAEVLERHLATEKGRREAMAEEMVLMRLEADGLKKQLRNYEGQHKTIGVKVKAKEQQYKNKLVELSQTVENQETERVIKNEHFKSLKEKLSETEKKLEELLKKHQMKPKSPTTSTAELMRLKAELQELNSAHKTDQCQLENFRTIIENQQTKINSMQRFNDMLLQDKKELFCRYRALCIKLETQKKHTKLIISERDHHREVLRAIDNQVEKLAKEADKKKTKFR